MKSRRIKRKSALHRRPTNQITNKFNRSFRLIKRLAKRPVRKIRKSNKTTCPTKMDRNKAPPLRNSTNKEGKSKMEEIWMSACRNVEISDDKARPWYEQIRQKMVQGSGRFYHNWDELLLRKEDYLRKVSASIVFAVFFQYYEFDGKRNCVEKNCRAFTDFCSDAGLQNENTMKLVKKLLGDETIDDIPGYEEEANLLQDLDLLVLGSSPDEYQRYTELLRKEYTHLDDTSYKHMRLKVLQTFLTIPTIFATEEFQSKLEETARANIKKEIEDLKK